MNGKLVLRALDIDIVENPWAVWSNEVIDLSHLRSPAVEMEAHQNTDCHLAQLLAVATDDIE